MPKVMLMNAFAKITEALTTYFDGLYYSDTSRLARVFHPMAHYVCVRV